MKIKKIIIYGFAILWSIITILPLLFTIISSLKSLTEIYSGPFKLPQSPHFDNYYKAFRSGTVFVGIGNSLFLSLSSVFIVLVITSMAAYIISRGKGRAINTLYIYLISGILIPVHCTFIPLVKMVGMFHMQNRYITMIIIYVAFNLPMSIFLITGYMKGISKELDESATIDGCGKFGTFFRIIAPIAMPSIATAGILAFLSIYNDLMFAVLFISKKNMKTVTLALQGFSGQFNTDLPVVFSGIIVAIVPLFIVYMLFQRQIISGIAAGAVKG